MIDRRSFLAMAPGLALAPRLFAQATATEQRLVVFAPAENEHGDGEYRVLSRGGEECRFAATGCNRRRRKTSSAWG